MKHLAKRQPDDLIRAVSTPYASSITTRAGSVLPWGSLAPQDHVKALALSGLSKADSSAKLASMLPDQSAEAEAIRERLHTKLRTVIKHKKWSEISEILDSLVSSQLAWNESTYVLSYFAPLLNPTSFVSGQWVADCRVVVERLNASNLPEVHPAFKQCFVNFSLVVQELADIDALPSNYGTYRALQPWLEIAQRCSEARRTQLRLAVGSIST